jgi:hypothetical protein
MLGRGQRGALICCVGRWSEDCLASSAGELCRRWPAGGGRYILGFVWVVDAGVGGVAYAVVDAFGVDV